MTAQRTKAKGALAPFAAFSLALTLATAPARSAEMPTPTVSNLPAPVTDDRHEITLAARLHLQDSEAGVLVVERHPLDGPDERFSGRGSVDRGLQKVGPEQGAVILGMEPV